MKNPFGIRRISAFSGGSDSMDRICLLSPSSVDGLSNHGLSGGSSPAPSHLSLPPPPPPTTKGDSDSQSVPMGAQPDPQEWTFTLYDIDKSGRVTQGDVLSLVRSISEVLSAVLTSSTPTPTGSLTAFKVKLTLIPTTSVVPETSTEISPEKVNLLTAQKSKNGNKKRKPQPWKSSSACPSEPSPSVAVSPLHELKRPRKFPFPVKLSYNDTDKCNNHPSEKFTSHNKNLPAAPSSWPCLGKGPRQKAIHQIYREFLHLSQLETCCCPGQDKNVSTLSGRTDFRTSPIRHCDRHCSCRWEKMTLRTRNHGNPEDNRGDKSWKFADCEKHYLDDARWNWDPQSYSHQQQLLNRGHRHRSARTRERRHRELSPRDPEMMYGQNFHESSRPYGVGNINFNNRIRNQAYFRAHKVAAAEAKEKFEKLAGWNTSPVKDNDTLS